MKISKPTLYIIVAGVVLAIAALAWNFYNSSQEDNPEAAPSSAPVAAKAPKTPAAQASASPAAKAPASPAAKASTAPAAKAPASPAAETSPSANEQAFREAVNKATNAAELTQTAKTKAEWDTVASNWQQAIALMKAVPKNNPKYQIAQQKVGEYQKNLNFAKEALKLAK